MKITRFFGVYFKYSLHDARVQKIEYIDGNLTFTFDYIFSYENGDEQPHKAKIVFEKCEFEVITETYNWGRAVFQGWLWTEGNPVHCIMNIYFTGKMVYVIDEA